ncbi:pyrroline-5-carboxylate reductase [Dermabacteraceae bacterium P9123]
MSELKDLTILCVGVGNMGAPVVRAFLASGANPERVFVRNSSDESSVTASERLGVQPVSQEELSDVAFQADVVVLGVKPQFVCSVARSLSNDMHENAALISIAAGVTVAQLTDAVGEGVRVVRAMPNTPIEVGSGVVALFGGDASARELAAELFAQAGEVVELDESLVHAEIAAAGSASAFVFYLIEAMIDNAVRLGLKRTDAERMVLATFEGSARLLRENGTHPAVARAAVCSPGGTTAQGVAELDAHGVRAGISAAMQATADTSRRMAGE